ncbi:MAG: Spx/MgsR family RNA polymerase-binding regulatory protein [Alicyclobacillus sp.]|nr:Spx/MgsR family RNA polymerase-binding regulatory protein [Alicyclobacillus sp.]
MAKTQTWSFYGYRKCSTCRQAHQFLRSLGVETEFQDFVQQPPTLAQLRAWAQQLGGVEPLINRRGTRYRELGLQDQSLSDEQWLTLLSQDGKLLKRPVLVADGRVVLGFDRAAYAALAGRS